jgi:ATP-binding cassette subfamily D (ALD) protein 3
VLPPSCLPPGVAERLILNQHLRRLLEYSGLSAFQRFVQQVGRQAGRGTSSDTAGKQKGQLFALELNFHEVAAGLPWSTLVLGCYLTLCAPPQIADGYFVKYFASVTALLVYAAPIYFQVCGWLNME